MYPLFSSISYMYNCCSVKLATFFIVEHLLFFAFNYLIFFLSIRSFLNFLIFRPETETKTNCFFLCVSYYSSYFQAYVTVQDCLNSVLPNITFNLPKVLDKKCEEINKLLAKLKALNAKGKFMYYYLRLVACCISFNRVVIINALNLTNPPPFQLFL